jgi:predicted oxidoreductase
MQKVQLGHSDLHVTPVCLGTMTFGEQVDEPTAHAILDRSLQRGINFIDTAEMYSVPARAETFGATETIIGNWFAKNPGARGKLVLATKVAGPSRGMPWVREGTGMTAKDIVASCEASLKRPEDRCDRSLPDPLAGTQRAHVRADVLRPRQGILHHFHSRATGGFCATGQAGQDPSHRPVQRNALRRA